MLDSKINQKFGRSHQVRSVFGVGALLMIFVAVTFVNQKGVNQLESSSLEDSRELASVAPMGVSIEDAAWKKQLAQSIASIPEVPSGKMARAASPFENFVFGELKGYYMMELQGDKVSEIFLKNKDAVDAPRYLGSEVSFLQKNKQMWWIGFSGLEVKETTPEKSVVTLLDSSKKAVGQADFSWDSSGRMVSLKLEKY